MKIYPAPERHVFSLLTLLCACILLAGCKPQSAGKTYAVIETEIGTCKILLFESTPVHTANFIKLAESGFYDSTLFHRVIPGFMIQGGDPDSKKAEPGQMLGQGGPGYELDPEIKGLHFQGALAAARLGDEVNPKKKSNGSQFFIVTGQSVTEEYLNALEKEKGIVYTPEQRKIYLQKGGAPMLDNEYTVFGQVVSGINIPFRIAADPRDGNNRPIRNLPMTVKIVKE